MTGIEIIKRQEGYPTQKEQLHGSLQVSYNDYGHLVLRLIEYNDKDNLIVLSQEATSRLMSFINNYFGDKKSIILNVQNLNVDKNDIPF